MPLLVGAGLAVVVGGGRPPGLAPAGRRWRCSGVAGLAAMWGDVADSHAAAAQLALRAEDGRAVAALRLGRGLDRRTARPADRTRRPGRSRAGSSVARRYSNLALASVVVLAASGTLRAIDEVGSWHAPGLDGVRPADPGQGRPAGGAGGARGSQPLPVRAPRWRDRLGRCCAWAGPSWGWRRWCWWPPRCSRVWPHPPRWPPRPAQAAGGHRPGLRHHRQGAAQHLARNHGVQPVRSGRRRLRHRPAGGGRSRHPDVLPAGPARPGPAPR